MLQSGPIHGLVYSQHRVSSQVKDAVDACASSAAAGWAVDGARTRKEAKAAYKQGTQVAIKEAVYTHYNSSVQQLYTRVILCTPCACERAATRNS